MDAQRLRRIINNKRRDLDASTVISLITKIATFPESEDAHYFRVTLKEVKNEELLDEIGVKNYLSMVAPVPFEPDFEFAEQIQDYFSENSHAIDEYGVFVNGKPVYKAYKTAIYDQNYETIGEFIGVDFFRVENDDDEVVALCWYGISDRLNRAMVKTNIDRGIRVRKNNITIGDDRTLNRLFPADRFNSHFVGEVHVLGSTFIPNARRDYFNDSKHIELFESKLRNIFKELEKLARISSDITNRFRDIEKFLAIEKNFMFNKDKEFDSSRQLTHQKLELERAQAVALAAKEKLEKIQRDFENIQGAKIVYRRIIGDTDLKIDGSAEKWFVEQPSFKLDRLLLGLDSDRRRIVLEIFGVIESELALWTVERVERLKMKIVGRLMSLK